MLKIAGASSMSMVTTYGSRAVAIEVCVCVDGLLGNGRVGVENTAGERRGVRTREEAGVGKGENGKKI